MAITIGSSNISSLRAQKSLSDATSKVADAYKQLSSGLRINDAADDAAGLAIASQLNSKAKVFTQAIRNVNDGVSAASIAEGALGALKDISTRQLELAEEAANGSYSLKQRQSLNTEANKLVDEYNRIVSSTSFNGLNLLDPALGTVLIQAGYGSSGSLQLGLSNQLQRAVGDGTFGGASTVSLGGLQGPESASTLDLNNDGKTDLIEFGADAISISLGNGDGTFQQAKTFAGVSGGGGVLGDFNGDGKIDLATSGSGLSVLLGNGDGTFGATSTFSFVGLSRSITEGDINGDGILDLITGDGFPYGRAITFLGNGNGTFATGTTILDGSTPRDMTLIDVNGDGKLDLISANSVGNTSVYLGNGNGTFSTGVTIASGGIQVQTGDFNNDGITDLLLASATGNTGIVLGNGNGTFSSFTTVGTGGLKDIQTGDFNGDGKLDFVSANGYGVTNVVLGNGDGTFKAGISTASVGGSAYNTASSIAVGDFDGDGRSDLVENSYYHVGAYLSTQTNVLLGNGGFSSNAKYLNINTQQGARDALSTVGTNLDRIDAQLGAIGATTSRFQTALSNLQTESQNFEAAASSIQDADVAQQAAVLVRTQILQQAAASVLAQANQQPALALTLLK